MDERKSSGTRLMAYSVPYHFSCSSCSGRFSCETMVSRKFCGLRYAMAFDRSCESNRRGNPEPLSSNFLGKGCCIVELSLLVVREAGAFCWNLKSISAISFISSKIQAWGEVSRSIEMYWKTTLTMSWYLLRPSGVSRMSMLKMPVPGQTS